jgi:hypothetical protein
MLIRTCHQTRAVIPTLIDLIQAKLVAAFLRITEVVEFLTCHPPPEDDHERQVDFPLGCLWVENNAVHTHLT